MILSECAATCYHGDYLDSESMMTSETATRHGLPVPPLGRSGPADHGKPLQIHRQGTRWRSGLDTSERVRFRLSWQIHVADGPLIYQDRNNPQSLNLYSS